MMRHSPCPIVVSHGLAWLQKWTVIGACHCWCIKLRHIRNVAETSLVVRHGNSNHNVPFQCLGSSKDTTYGHLRKSNNGKRTRKQTRLIRSSGAWGRNVVHIWTLFLGHPGPLFVHFVGGSALSTVTVSEAENPLGAHCSLQYSFSPGFTSPCYSIGVF